MNVLLKNVPNGTKLADIGKLANTRAEDDAPAWSVLARVEADKLLAQLDGKARDEIDHLVNMMDPTEETLRFTIAGLQNGKRFQALSNLRDVLTPDYCDALAAMPLPEAGVHVSDENRLSKMRKPKVVEAAPVEVRTDEEKRLEQLRKYAAMFADSNEGSMATFLQNNVRGVEWNVLHEIIRENHIEQLSKFVGAAGPYMMAKING